MSVEREARPIRSYRVCFSLERRIYKIDRWRLPVPWGVPLRTIGYAVLALAAVLFAQRLPLLGELVAALPAPVRLALLPGGIAWALTQLSLDGRPAHAALAPYLRQRLRRGRLARFGVVEAVGEQVRLGELAVMCDERSGRLRRARIEGPARVVVRYPARAEQKGRRLRLRQSSAQPMYRGKQISVAEGARLELG